MLFDLNGNTYQIKFFRDQLLTTHAELYIKGGDTFQYLITNWAYLNPKDKFEKSKGRKVALAKLLKLANETAAFPRLSKEDRAKIWEIYFKEHRK